MGKKKSLIIGSTYSSKSYGDFKVIEDNGAFDVKVEFILTGYTKKVQRGGVTTGSIKDPYYPSVYGIAWLGEGKFTARVGGKLTKSYQEWTGMLSRCYGTTKQHHWQSYRLNVEVCEEWLCFQDYAAWYERGCIEGWEVDKDVLCTSSKIYSPETCLFLPPRLNKCFIGKNRVTEYPIGVTPIKGDIGYIARLNVVDIREYLGYFLCPYQAFAKYKSEKEKLIRSLAVEYEGLLPKRTYEALMNYEVKDPSSYQAHLHI